VKFLVAGLLFPLACAASDVITGTVGAPGGRLALQSSFFVGAAHAHVPGLQAVVGATVELVEGGKVLASGKTNARGIYEFAAPARFQPGPRYMVRAGSAGQRLEAFVTALRTNIDPATDATAKLLSRHAGRLRTTDVQEVLPLVQHLAWEVDLPAAHSGAALAAMLREAASNDEEIFNIVASMGAAAEIHGRVTDAAKKPLARITILVRDPASGVVRAMGHTDTQGRYRVRVAQGDYAISALNETAASMAASERAKASTGVARDFAFAAGGRVSGLVTAPNGARLTNVRVKLLDGRGAAAEARTQDDGSYRFNVAPGSYALLAENTTLQPFASNLPGKPITVKRGGDLTANLVLADGEMVSGAAAPGSNVRIVDAETREPVHVLRTNRAGRYRLWLKPGRYAAQ
jgi:hypothetical protein